MNVTISCGMRKAKSILPLICASGIAVSAIAACSFTQTSPNASNAQTTHSPTPETTTPTSTPGKISAVSFRKTTVLSGLEHPWSMAWLPDGAMLITERPGRLRIVRDRTLDPVPVAGVPTVLAFNQGGLMDVSLHPRFAENQFVYLTYSHGTRTANRTRVARGTFDGKALKNVQVIFEVSQVKPDGQHFGSRMLWLPDGTMLVAIGDGGNPPVELDGDLIRKQAQNLRSHLGKIVRLNDDGSVPRDNPFVTRSDADPVIWSYGHRNIQGLAFDPISNQVWSTEHGARGGDELNLVQAGKNYGWPLVTHSKEYFGPEISQERSRPGMVDPKIVWTPAKAPSGLAFYTGDRFSQWKGNLFAGGLVSRSISRISLDSSSKVISQEAINIGQRVRDVRQGPDGLLYILTDESNGQLIRLEPS
ncbi:glucose/sorbosone dehydrogenase [Leptolyngbyaceae cyanobacterium JSC-12]|nr:glucose/sorbosone dehydrogenase [Leptolyngbyaceae cyanobacterium JSC-12]